MALLGSALALAVAFGWFVPVPRLVLLRFRSPRTSAFIEARQDRLRAEGKSDAIDRRPVPLTAVSPALVRAVIVAEDARFFDHQGIDWDAVSKAREWNRRQSGKKHPRLRGASTITQQLAKNLYLSGSRSWLRKGREAAIAAAMEVLVPKAKILEHYLSGIEWGERTYGCEAASRTYFRTSCAALSADQAAWLAAMIPGPRVYLANPERHRRRAAKIARLAAASGPVERPAPDEDDKEPGGPR